MLFTEWKLDMKRDPTINALYANATPRGWCVYILYISVNPDFIVPSMLIYTIGYIWDNLTYADIRMTTRLLCYSHGILQYSILYCATPHHTCQCHFIRWHTLEKLSNGLIAIEYISKSIRIDNSKMITLKTFFYLLNDIFQMKISL